MKITKEDQILHILNIVKFATLYNLEPWFYKRAETLSGRLNNPYRLLLRLLRKGLIRKVGVYPVGEQLFKWNTFYTPTDSKVDPMSFPILRHESGIIDILMGLMFLYPDYDLSIRHRPQYKIGNRRYCPDLEVTLTGERTHTYLVEMERTREPKEIMDKLNEIAQYGSPRDYGLPQFTKILVVLSHQNYAGYWRPTEYDKPEVARQLRLIDTRLESVLKLSKHLPNFFFFMKFPDFYRLNEAVWYTPEGKKVQLIN